MNSSYYKYCIVPQCKSTTIKTPDKLFIYVPNNRPTREKWLTLALRSNAHCLSISKNRRMYFCEDHFDLPNDMLNYTEYHIMGKVSQVRMIQGCTPSKFECQEDRSKRKSNSTELSDILKKQRMAVLGECLNKPEESCGSSSSLKDIPHTSSADPEPFQVKHEEAEMEDEVPRVCRACLASGVRMFDVAARGLQDTFEYVTGTELRTTDERPTQVCYVCCSQLQRFRAFCQMSRRAEAYMTKLVKRGLQITEQEVSKRHRLIKPKLNVTKNPLIAVHSQEDPEECAVVEVKVEVNTEEEDKNISDSETESETEIGSEVKTGTYVSERENETEEMLPDFETEREIKIEIDEIEIEEFDPFEAIDHSKVSDETCRCLQCAEAFPSQSELLKHAQNHKQKKLKQQNVTTNVESRESQCMFCNQTFELNTQLVTHVATEHGFVEFAQNSKRRKPNIPNKSSK